MVSQIQMKFHLAPSSPWCLPLSVVTSASLCFLLGFSEDFHAHVCARATYEILFCAFRTLWWLKKGLLWLSPVSATCFSSPSKICLEDLYMGAHRDPSYSFQKTCFNLFIYFEREGGHKQGRRREKQRQNPKQTACRQHRAQRGAQTHETARSWPEPKGRVGRLTDYTTQVPCSYWF